LDESAQSNGGISLTTSEALKPWLGRALDNLIWSPAFKGQLDGLISRGPFPPQLLYALQLYYNRFEGGAELCEWMEQFREKLDQQNEMGGIAVWLQAWDELWVDQRCSCAQSRIQI